MRQELLVNGEPVETLAAIFPYIRTRRHGKGRMDVSIDGVPLDVMASFVRALMRREARLLKEDADRVDQTAIEPRNDDQRRLDALVDLVISISAALKYQATDHARDRHDPLPPEAPARQAQG